MAKASLETTLQFWQVKNILFRVPPQTVAVEVAAQRMHLIIQSNMEQEKTFRININQLSAGRNITAT